MGKFISGLIQVIEDDRGSKSSKRVSGLFLIFSGGFAKLILMVYGARIKLLEEFTLYDKVDISAESMLWIGATLLGISMAEKFRKKDDK